MASTRTALYYPKIVIQNKQWIRQAILYWDDIGSIVPREIWDYHPYFELEDQDIYQLHEAGLYRPFHPENLMRLRRGSQQRFIDEFFNRLDDLDEEYHFTESDSYSPIYESKDMKSGIFNRLEERGLAKRKLGEKITIFESDQPVVFLEENTSDIYMGLLAEYFADNDERFTIPVTDKMNFQDLIFCGTSEGERQIGARIIFDNFLPVPKEDVSITNIIDFKRECRGELIRLRREIDGFQSEVVSLENSREILAEATRFSESVEEGMIDLRTAMKENRIETALGSVSALVNVKQPEWFGTLATAGVIGYGTGEYGLCLLGGLAVNSAVSVGRYVMKQNIRRNEILRDSPYSYLYHAQQKWT